MSDTIDMSGLDRKLRELQSALMHGPGSMAQVVSIEAGQLAWEIGEQIGPKTVKAGVAGIARDARQILNDTPRPSNLSHEQQFVNSKYGAFTWLQSGPAWLLGIRDQDDLREQSAAAVLNTYLDLRGIPFEKTYEELGSRGRQHVRRLNRKLVSPSSFAGAVKTLSQKIGQAKASFAITAAELIPFKRIPAWVRKQFPAVASNQKSIFNPAGLNHPTQPWIEFGSRAPGVEHNPFMRQKIQNAVTKRFHDLEAKVRKVLNGHIYNLRTGQVYRPRPDQLS